MRLSGRMKMLLLAGLVLAIYFVSIGTPVNPVDDNALIQWLHDNEHLPFSAIFSWTTGAYYRPLLQSTFLLDMKLWGAASSFMHLENILLHLANTLLIFFSATIINRNIQLRLSWTPFAAAALFAIHPINTEAVNWIAGRSDLLACFFVMLASLALLRGMELRQPGYLYLSLLLLIPGLLCKETAVFFLPAAVLLIIADDIFLSGGAAGLTQRIKLRFSYLLPYFILPAVYLLLRGVFLASNSFGLQSIKRLLIESERGVSESLFQAVSGIGFYSKKLFFPWPLNFTIGQVPDYAFWLGLLVLLVLVHSMWHTTFVKGLYLMTFAIGLSALLALLLRPAWTPVAERYLYLPSAFFCMALVFSCSRHFVGFLRSWGGGIILVLAVGMTYTTVQRNLLWQDNLLLFQDAVKKSPEFPFVRTVYADLLIKAGRAEEGNEIIRTTVAPEGLRNVDFLKLKQASLFFREGHYQDARDLIFEARDKDSQLYFLFQQLLADVDTKLLEMVGEEQRQQLLEETVAVLLELKQSYQDPFYYYRAGKLYLQYDLNEKAAEYFQKAAKEAPEGVFYKGTAAALAEKLTRL